MSRYPSGLGLYGDADHGIGEFHGLKHDRMVLVAKGVARADILEAYSGADVAAADHLFRVLLVGVHPEKAGDSLLLAAAAVEHVAAALDFA